MIILGTLLPSTKLKLVHLNHWTKCIEHFIKERNWGAIEYVFLHDSILPDSGKEKAASAIPLVPFVGTKTDNEQILLSLISHGSSVNSAMANEDAEESEVTPLRAAHKAGNQRLAVFLVQHGANPVSIAPSGLPLHVASSWAVNSKQKTSQRSSRYDIVFDR